MLTASVTHVSQTKNAVKFKPMVRMQPYFFNKSLGSEWDKNSIEINK